MNCRPFFYHPFNFREGFKFLINVPKKKPEAVSCPRLDDVNASINPQTDCSPKNKNEDKYVVAMVCIRIIPQDLFPSIPTVSFLKAHPLIVVFQTKFP